MPDSVPPGPGRLYDPWAPGKSLPLDRFLERHQFPPWLMALSVTLIAFVLFQGISLAATTALLAAEGVGADDLLTDFARVIEEHLHRILTANTIGQVLGLALPVLLLLKLHSSRGAAFVRIRSTDARLMGLSLLGWAAFVPVVQWLGEVNQRLPLPESIRQLEAMQLELIEAVLLQDVGLLFSLSMLAVTPALCEELLFRGYVQRQGERSFGVAGGIALSGLLFGFYHLRLTQVLPLSALGLYLAYLAWRTGSLWVPVVVHFANNAFAVFVGAYVSSRPNVDVNMIESMSLPWYAVLFGALLFGAVLYALHRAAHRVLAEREAVHRHEPEPTSL